MTDMQQTQQQLDSEIDPTQHTSSSIAVDAKQYVFLFKENKLLQNQQLFRPWQQNQWNRYRYVERFKQQQNFRQNNNNNQVQEMSDILPQIDINKPENQDQSNRQEYQVMQECEYQYCGNINFSKRKECNLCGSLKPNKKNKKIKKQKQGCQLLEFLLNPQTKNIPQQQTEFSKDCCVDSIKEQIKEQIKLCDKMKLSSTSKEKQYEYDLQNKEGVGKNEILLNTQRKSLSENINEIDMCTQLTIGKKVDSPIGVFL